MSHAAHRESSPEGSVRAPPRLVLVTAALSPASIAPPHRNEPPLVQRLFLGSLFLVWRFLVTVLPVVSRLGKD